MTLRKKVLYVAEKQPGPKMTTLVFGFLILAYLPRFIAHALRPEESSYLSRKEKSNLLFNVLIALFLTVPAQSAAACPTQSFLAYWR